MNTVDWSTYKFHASAVKSLMVASRSKTDPLSETTKSYLQEIYIQEVFGRRRPVTTNPMKKGTMAESEGLSLIQEVKGVTYFKNQKQLSNEYVCGTPDVIDEAEKAIRDMKLSWDLWSFAKSDEKSAKADYYWQIVTYCWMKGFFKGSIFYGLVNTPEVLITDEIYRLQFSMPEDEAAKYRQNYVFDDIPATVRLKQIDFEIDPQDIELLKNKIIAAREYLKGMSL